ncbi:ABC transporter ATP-binding protein [Carnimonas nigrificans]|uniref:ABC transporter ATP-binding protein n=1 Tax=Carnimonas nigrificans TaxID=64323 RepID=UPI00047292E7|nr:sn-glycerol-3-phosphate ABC transporter ATP-binding protein UgpC [Carnimonas nigrificans]
MADVRLQQVKKEFGGNLIIKGVDLEIKNGEFAVLVGPSGCGKSTLLRLIAGLESISDGELHIGGQLVNDLPPRERGVGMVFQSYALYPHMTVFDNIAFGLKLAGQDKEAVRQRVMETAKILQLDELMGRKPKQLSGGQRQRVAIGRAIARESDILLMDEPLSNLDAALRVRMRVEIARLHKLLGSTMIYVTHDQTEAMTLADKIVVLNAGHIEQAGSPRELFERPANTFVAGFIGSPKMNFFDVEVSTSDEQGVQIQGKGISAIRLPFASTGGTSRLTLGIRPEHMQLTPSNDQHSFTVSNIEYLGNEIYVYLLPPDGTSNLDMNFPVCRAPAGNELAIGDKVAVSFSVEHAHLFDGDGQALPRPGVTAIEC